MRSPLTGSRRRPQHSAGFAQPAHRDLVANLAVGLVAAIEDGVVLVDACLRVIACNPAAVGRMPGHLLCDDSGRLRPPGLIRMARRALDGTEETATGWVELRASPPRMETGVARLPGSPSPTYAPRPRWPAAGAGDAGGQAAPTPELVPWRPLVRAVPLGTPERACALVLHDPGPAAGLASARDLIATLSHELKSPLLHARQAVDVLTQYQVEEDPNFCSAVDRASWSVRQIAAVVRDLVDLLNLEDPGRLEVRRTAVDLVPLVRSVAGTYSALATACAIVLDFEAEASCLALPPLRLDEPLIARALGNLLDNALKYAAGAGPVTLRVRRAGSLANVEVEDRGPGIALADQRRIFEPFVRVATGGDTMGSGLGLAIAQRIVRGHGGTLTVESKPGAGAIFRLSLLIPPGS